MKTDEEIIMNIKERVSAGTRKKKTSILFGIISLSAALVLSVALALK